MKAITVKNQKNTERKLTIVVGTNVSKKAVERNKIRRRVRAIMQKEDKAKQYVIIVHPGAKNLLFQELKNQIERQLVISN